MNKEKEQNIHKQNEKQGDLCNINIIIAKVIINNKYKNKLRLKLF
jgi:hypothetical protein